MPRTVKSIKARDLRKSGAQVFDKTGEKIDKFRLKAIEKKGKVKEISKEDKLEKMAAQMVEIAKKSDASMELALKVVKEALQAISGFQVDRKSEKTDREPEKPEKPDRKPRIWEFKYKKPECPTVTIMAKEIL